MEKKMKNEMETRVYIGVIVGLFNYFLCYAAIQLQTGVPATLLRVKGVGFTCMSPSCVSSPQQALIPTQRQDFESTSFGC